MYNRNFELTHAHLKMLKTCPWTFKLQGSCFISMYLGLNKTFTFFIDHDYHRKVRLIFLNWIPWLLLMNRPGHPLSLKTLMMKRSLRELPATSDSKSLLFKALDMADVDNVKAKDASSHPKSPITFSPLSPKFHNSVKLLSKVCFSNDSNRKWMLNIHSSTKSTFLLGTMIMTDGRNKPVRVNPSKFSYRPVHYFLT